MDSGLFLVDLPASRVEPSHHSVSNHLSSPCDRDLVFVPQAYRQDDPRVACVPSGPCVSWTSPLGSRLVTTKSRIEFVILRTGSSPPVALHLPSRGRSYLLLQNADHALVGTLTPLVHHAHRRTATAGLPSSASSDLPSSTRCGLWRDAVPRVQLLAHGMLLGTSGGPAPSRPPCELRQAVQRTT